MRSGIVTFIAVLLALGLGCGATRHPRVASEAVRASALARPAPAWVVGIREPEIRYADPEQGEPPVVRDVREAAYLIDALRGTELFEAVDFSKQLPCPADLELVVLPVTSERLSSAPLWLWPLTLSLVILDDEQGVSFSPAQDPGVEYRFPYPTRLVVGILPLIAIPVLLSDAVPTWSLSGPERDEELAVYLRSELDRLASYVSSDAREACGDHAPEPEVP